MEVKERKITFPEILNVRLIADVSGSMVQPGRMDALKKTLVLLVSSLDEFRAKIRWQKGRVGAIKTEVGTQVWKYDNQVQKVKGFHSETDPVLVTGEEDESDRDEEDKIDHSWKEELNEKAFGSEEEYVKLAAALQVLYPRGGNDESLALKTVSEDIFADGEYAKKVRDDRALDIVFMISDGGAAGVKEARENIQEMNEAGVVCRAFQIGDVSSDEEETFNQLWNDGEELGTVVGKDVRNLPKALSESLRSILAGRIG